MASGYLKHIFRPSQAIRDTFEAKTLKEDEEFREKRGKTKKLDLKEEANEGITARNKSMKSLGLMR